MIAKLIGFFKNPSNKICPKCKGDKYIDCIYDYERPKIDERGCHTYWEKTREVCPKCQGTGTI